jgi:hypothetical protein
MLELVLYHTELVKIQDLVPEVVVGSMELAAVLLSVLIVLAPTESSGTQKPGAVLVLCHTELVVTELKMPVELKLMQLSEVQDLAA